MTDEQPTMKTRIGLCLILLAAATPLLAQTPSADEIAEKSQQAFHYAGQDMSARVVMTLVTRRSRKSRSWLTSSNVPS